MARLDKAAETQSGIFKAPLSKTDMRSHVLTVMLALIHQVYFVFGRHDPVTDKALVELIGLPNLSGLFEFDLTASDLGMTHEAVARSGLATEMEVLYDLAYHGMIDGKRPDLDSESGASWVSRVLFDFNSSTFASEWDNYSECKVATAALLDICETAEARLTLEKHQGLLDDTFMDWHGPYLGNGDRLTFRQLSLLSGMSEASLRTMASRDNAKNNLKIHTEGRNAYIEAKDARDWLISKGRYVPLVYANPAGAVLDLVREKLVYVDELVNRLNQRLHFLLGQDDREDVMAALREISPDLLVFSAIGNHPSLNLAERDARLLNEAFLAKLGIALQLPPRQLALKMKQLALTEELQAIQKQLTETEQTIDKSASRRD